MWVVVIVLCAILSLSCGDALWGQIGGNPQHTAFSTQALSQPCTLVPLWNRTSSLILSACVVDSDGSYLCFTGSKTSIYIVQISTTGKANWEQDITKDISGCGLAPVLALDSVSSTLYVFLGIGVLGYNSTNGKFLWKVENAVSPFTAIFISVNEILHEGYIFGDGSLVCITGEGAVKWNMTIFEPQTDNETVGSPPSISQDGNSLFLHYPGSLIKLNAADGTTIWNVTLDGAISDQLTFDSPVVDVVRNYVLAVAVDATQYTNVYVLDQTNGEMKAKFPIPAAFSWEDNNPVTAYQPLVLFDNGILVANINGEFISSYDMEYLTMQNMLAPNSTTYTRIISMAGTSDGTLYVEQVEMAPDKKPSQLCAINSSKLQYIQCTEIGNHMTLFYPLLVGQSSLLIQYVVTTNEFASFGN